MKWSCHQRWTCCCSIRLCVVSFEELSQSGSPHSQMTGASCSADTSATILCLFIPDSTPFFLQELPFSQILPFMVNRSAPGPRCLKIQAMNLIHNKTNMCLTYLYVKHIFVLTHICFDTYFNIFLLTGFYWQEF